MVRSDAELLEAIHHGDQHAAATLMCRYHGWALDYTRKKGAGQDAPDIAHDVLVALLQDPPRQLQRRTLHALLGARLRFRVIDSVQKRSQEGADVGELAELGTGASERARRRRAATQTVEAIERLRSTERRLLHMRYMEDMEPVEIAAKTGRSAAAIRAALFRAKASLRLELGLASR